MNTSSDPTLIYYVDYLRYQFLNVGFDNLAVVVWKNVDQTLYGIGSLILPKVVDLSMGQDSHASTRRCSDFRKSSGWFVKG